MSNNSINNFSRSGMSEKMSKQQLSTLRRDLDTLQIDAVTKVEQFLYLAYYSLPFRTSMKFLLTCRSSLKGIMLYVSNKSKFIHQHTKNSLDFWVLCNNIKLSDSLVQQSDSAFSLVDQYLLKRKHIIEDSFVVRRCIELKERYIGKYGRLRLSGNDAISGEQLQLLREFMKTVRRFQKHLLVALTDELFLQFIKSREYKVWRGAERAHSFAYALSYVVEEKHLGSSLDVPFAVDDSFNTMYMVGSSRHESNGYPMEESLDSLHIHAPGSNEATTSMTSGSYAPSSMIDPSFATGKSFAQESISNSAGAFSASVAEEDLYDCLPDVSNGTDLVLNVCRVTQNAELNKIIKFGYEWLTIFLTAIEGVPIGCTLHAPVVDEVENKKLPIIYANQSFADIVMPERGSVKNSRVMALKSRKDLIGKSLINLFDSPSQTEIMSILTEKGEESRYSCANGSAGSCHTDSSSVPFSVGYSCPSPSSAGSGSLFGKYSSHHSPISPMETQPRYSDSANVSVSGVVIGDNTTGDSQPLPSGPANAPLSVQFESTVLGNNSTRSNGSNSESSKFNWDPDQVTDCSGVGNADNVGGEFVRSTMKNWDELHNSVASFTSEAFSQNMRSLFNGVLYATVGSGRKDVVVACKPLCCSTEGKLEYYVCLHFATNAQNTVRDCIMLENLLQKLPDFVYKSEDAVDGHFTPIKYDTISVDVNDIEGDVQACGFRELDNGNMNYNHSYIISDASVSPVSKAPAKSFFKRVMGRSRANSKVGVDGGPPVQQEPSQVINNDDPARDSGRKSFPSSISNSVTRMFGTFLSKSCDK